MAIKLIIRKSIAVGMCLPLLALAQVPNGNFETWTTESSTIPESWTSSGKITKVTGSGGSGNAVSLSNHSASGTFSTLMQAGFDTGAFLAPYFAYNGTPDSVYIVYRCNLGLDTASFTVAFTKSGESLPLAYSDILIYGNSGGWVTRVFPVNYIHGVPQLSADSGYLLLQSADPVFGPMSDGTLDIDEITFGFANNNPAPLIPNYSFDNWQSASVEYPESWVSYHRYLYDQGVKKNFSTKTTDKYDGDYAAVLEPFVAPNPETGFSDTFPNALVTIRPGLDPLESGMFEPAFPVSQRYTSFRGRYKTFLNNGDVALVWVHLFKNGTVVGSAFHMAAVVQSVFTEFSEDFTYDSGFAGNPDSATVVLMLTDSTMTGVNSLSSRALFDNLYFDNWNTGVASDMKKLSGLYPNPSSGQVQLKILAPRSETAAIVLRDIQGKNVLTKDISLMAGQNRLNLDFSGFTKGIYYLHVQLNQKNELHKIILTQ